MKSSQFFIVLFLLFVTNSVISEKLKEIFLSEPELCMYTECHGQSRGVTPCQKGFSSCGTYPCFITGLDPGRKTKCCTKSCLEI
ncbi:unnamed protein product [Adineta steineri]|uniref:Uncharacterized protein n=1 Tax=Adineta steineri TaxID=433720 RepID=A0A818GRC1_9BILA|nr:unnamed protein product [Adineta steineri]CAF1037530.1 unnamed protein product [Adineta steineri]CAF1120540.1 unnamed protein product [Adineta steineri]CAF3492800.1 unnamed protein product [Adineta steineri]CAF3541437.1 unnamed protein product [Adineta steineri]